MQPVFITGASGYIGRRLARMLVKENIPVTALARQQSVKKIPAGCSVVVADPFSPDSFSQTVPANGVFVQLLGVSHPGPRKKELFVSIDLASVRASVKAAQDAGIGHFIYVSVAQFPTRLMKDYQEVRAAAESILMHSGMKVTIIRPWYVVGPGHYWPLLLLPFYALLKIIPSTAPAAKALQLVSLRQMLITLKRAVADEPLSSLRVIEIDEMRGLKFDK